MKTQVLCPDLLGRPTIATMPEDQIILVDGARTPIGSFGGVLKDVPAHQLGATAARAALTRSGVSGEDIGEVVMGCIGQVGPDAYNARRVAFAAGCRQRAGIHRQPALRVRAAGDLVSGDADALGRPGPRAGRRRRVDVADAVLRLRCALRATGSVTARWSTEPSVMLTDPFHDIHMGVTAENVARSTASRALEQDEFAAGVPAPGGDRRGQGRLRRGDRAGRGRRPQAGRRRPTTSTPSPTRRWRPWRRCVRPSSRAGRSPPATRPASTTAPRPSCWPASPSPQDRGLTGLVALEAVATAAMEPELMGYAPVLALRRCSSRPARRRADIGTIELNEAFASQAVAVIRDAKLDPAQVNPYGGAIALGHPGRRDRRHPHAAGRQGPRPSRPRAGRRHHVHRRGPGPRSAVPPDLKLWSLSSTYAVRDRVAHIVINCPAASNRRPADSAGSGSRASGGRSGRSPPDVTNFKQGA